MRSSPSAPRPSGSSSTRVLRSDLKRSRAPAEEKSFLVRIAGIVGRVAREGAWGVEREEWVGG